MTTLPTRVPPLNARDLQVLVAVAQHGRLVAAAEWLKVSPSALSRTVTRVEKLLGVTLFVRSTRRVEITAAGREFVGIAERMLVLTHLTSERQTPNRRLANRDRLGV